MQGLAALALGDLHGALSNKNPDSAKLALDRLVAMFRSEKTPQSVRWAVADALALLDITQVSQSLTEPLLAELADPLQRKQLKEVAKLREDTGVSPGASAPPQLPGAQIPGSRLPRPGGEQGIARLEHMGHGHCRVGPDRVEGGQGVDRWNRGGQGERRRRSRSCSRSRDSELTCAKRRSTRWPFWAISVN